MSAGVVALCLLGFECLCEWGGGVRETERRESKQVSKPASKRQRQTDRENKKKKRERTQNSELYYSRIEILGSSLFLQSVLAMLHRQHI